MSDLRPHNFTELGADAGRGNLLGVQPYMTTRDYASEEACFAKLDGYMQAARGRGWLSPRTVVVWPEYIGAWLASTGAGPADCGCWAITCSPTAC